MIQLDSKMEYRVQARAQRLIDEDRKVIKMPMDQLFPESAVAESLRQFGYEPRLVDMPTRVRIVNRLFNC